VDYVVLHPNYWGDAVNILGEMKPPSPWMGTPGCGSGWFLLEAQPTKLQRPQSASILFGFKNFTFNQIVVYKIKKSKIIYCYSKSSEAFINLIPALTAATNRTNSFTRIWKQKRTRVQPLPQPWFKEVCRKKMRNHNAVIEALELMLIYKI